MAGIAIDTQEQGGVGIRTPQSRTGVGGQGMAAHVLWGNIIGSIDDQADLKEKFQTEAEARQAADQAEVEARQQAINDLLPLIYAGL